MGRAPLTEASSAAQQERPARPLLSIGITTASWMRMGEELGRLEDAGADFVHVDVMDGRFCPQLTVGPQVIGALHTRLRKDVHLMVEEPLEKLAAYVDAGADVITFHVEATRHPHRVLQALGSMHLSGGRSGSITRGIALNPGTPVSAIEPLLDGADLVLVLAVNPGWGGQSFGSATQGRLEAARRLIEGCGRKVLLGVDGGVTLRNVAAIAAMDVDVIVAGSAVFDGGDPVANLKEMQGLIGRGVVS
ncbi:MAG: ribulose-phosphate 3-epimerase [Candidatus Dormibacterales bacterium]